MNDIAISVNNLSKVYRIGLKEERPETMAGALWSWLKSPVESYRSLRRLNNFEDVELAGIQNPESGSQTLATNGGPRSQRDDIIWALKNVSFEVKKGEVLGVIGRNGAGKSTLLKILSGITEPTRGRAEIYGRVASLLEVGTGFHPDLTGRENVYLNGTMLGMTKKEIDLKFDEIVDFSGIEKFIDTPVKRYSSGMYVRLAFSVAAHLEPEILLVDEVLAVGDMDFQSKCLGKMGDITKSGRTILFVSHNMVAIRNLCQSVLHISDGMVTNSGSADAVVDAYLHIDQKGSTQLPFSPISSYEDLFRLMSVSIGHGDSTIDLNQIECGKDVMLSMKFLSRVAMRNIVVAVGLNNTDGMRIVTMHSGIAGSVIDFAIGENTVVCCMPRFSISPGRYILEAKILHENQPVLHISCLAHLEVRQGDFYGTGKFPDASWQGCFQAEQQWQITSNT